MEDSGSVLAGMVLIIAVVTFYWLVVKALLAILKIEKSSKATAEAITKLVEKAEERQRLDDFELRAARARATGGAYTP